MAAVELRNIGKSFGKTEVLRDVSLDIADREFMTLVGPSGCGKSTLLRIVAGLESQDSGRVLIDGHSVDGHRATDRDLAMVFQSYALYPHLTVRRNIAVPLVMRRLNMAQRLPVLGRLLPGASAILRDIARDVAAVADTLQIQPLLDRKPGQLSGGQRQRVALLGRQDQGAGRRHQRGHHRLGHHRQLAVAGTGVLPGRVDAEHQ